jgi:hypothetical protein
MQHRSILGGAPWAASVFPTIAILHRAENPHDTGKQRNRIEPQHAAASLIVIRRGGKPCS